MRGIIKIIRTINSTDIHQVEYRQHNSDSLEQISCPRIPVFNDHCYGTKNSVNDREINDADPKALEKRHVGAENAGAKYEQVHENDVGHHYIQEDQWFLTAVSLDRHGTKIDRRNAKKVLKNGKTGVFSVELKKRQYEL